MTNPLVPGPDLENQPESEPDPDGDVLTEDAVNEQPENDNTEYWVKTPWYIDTMSFDDVVVTPAGVKLTGKQRERAYEVAKEAGVTLKSKEA